jgi:DNA-binding transcriptional LysR family regulator
MEIFELKYFLAVANSENIHRASEKLNVSPGSLSKAIQRLENELSVSLFSKEGRNIRLTDHGKLLQKKASEIVHLEESTRLALGGHQGSIQVVIAGPEVLLAEMGIQFSANIKKKFPLSSFEYHHADDEQAIGKVARGEAHLAIVTSDVPTNLGLTTKILADTSFQTYVGKGHPLFGIKKGIPVEEILEHPFASPNHPLLGQVHAKQSLDGWRDDQFPRKVEYLTSSLKILEEFVLRGQAIAYLPEYYGERLGLQKLKVLGCPYVCTQKVRLVSRNPKEIGWLNQII